LGSRCSTAEGHRFTYKLVEGDDVRAIAGRLTWRIMKTVTGALRSDQVAHSPAGRAVDQWAVRRPAARRARAPELLEQPRHKIGDLELTEADVRSLLERHATLG
jgi:hypothetical protein